jgi:hypothetical protein
MKTKTERKTKPRSRKIDDPAQRQRFIEAAREAGASEDEAVFDEALKQIAKAKPVKLKENNGG